MPRFKILMILALCWVAATLSEAASVEEARGLYQKGDELGAREVLIEILVLETDGAVRAQALDLVGMIAVDRGDLDFAAAVWEKLIRDYPDSPEAAEARTKVSLATDLSQVRAENPKEQGVVAPTETERPAPAPVPTAVEEQAAPVLSEPAEVPEPAGPAAPATTEQRAPQSDLVLVAGRGRPHAGAQRAADLVIEHLQSRGVVAETATKGVPVVEQSAQVVPALLRQLEEEGGNSVLLVTSDFEKIGKVVVECYTPEGELVWKKRVTGGTGWTGRAYSATGVNENLVERILEKLDKQIGGLCLPASN